MTSILPINLDDLLRHSGVEYELPHETGNPRQH